MRRHRRLILLAGLLTVLPVAAQERHVSLEECLQLAAQHDPDLRGARLDLQAARARRSEARWEYAPRVFIDGFGYHALRPLVHIAPSDILEGYWSDVLSSMATDAAWQAGITPWYEGFRQGWGAFALAMQPVYAGGRIAVGNRLADLGVRAGELQLSVKQRETDAAIEERFRRGISLQEKMRTLDKTRQLLDSLERSVQAAVDAGLISDSDLLQVQLKQRELSSGRIRLRSGLKLAKMDLFNAIGLPYAYLELDSFILDGDASGAPLPPSAWVVDEADVVPDESRLLAMQVEAAGLQKRLAVGEYLPQASLGVTYGYSDFRGNGQGKLNGLGFAVLHIPITDLGKAGARARRYDAEVEKARVQQEYLDAQLTLQMHQLRLEMESAWEQLGVAREAVRVARDAADKLQVRYSAGQVTMSDLLQAELSVREAEEAEIDREMDYNMAVNAYLRRCGKL